MAYDSYASFRTAIYARLDIQTGDITTTSMDDCIRDAEDFVNKSLRVPEMETSMTNTAVVTTGGVITMPSDYADAKDLYLNASPIISLSKKTAEWIYRNYPDRSSTGRPAFFAEEGTKFIFGPASAEGYTMQGIYYAKPASLPGTSTLNSVFSAYPTIYLAASCAEAERMLRRFESASLWDARASGLIAQANEAAKRRAFSGRPLRMVPG